MHGPQTAIEFEGNGFPAASGEPSSLFAEGEKDLRAVRGSCYAPALKTQSRRADEMQLLAARRMEKDGLPMGYKKQAFVLPLFISTVKISCKFMRMNL